MKKSKEVIGFQAVALSLTTVFAVLCLLPILYTVTGSFTPERELARGLKLIPKHWTLEAYRMVWKNPAGILRAYGITTALVVFGVGAGLIMVTMTAYVLYRKDCRARRGLSFFFFFTTLFSGGMVPYYIWMCRLGLRDTFGILLFNGLFSVFYMFIVRTYFTSNIPVSLVESAKVDGANDFIIYLRIVMPSAKPVLATIGLMQAIAYWNNWSTAAVFITETNLYPLQFYLYRIFQDASLRQKLMEAGVFVNGSAPMESYKLAMTVVTMGPVILFYPFVQKYFVAGVTIGAVKE